MSNPLNNLKFLPWQVLLQTSAITTLIFIVADFLIFLGATKFSVIFRIYALLYKPPLGMFISLAVALGIGALAVYLMEQMQPRFILNTGSLWGLVGCLLLFIGLKTLLPIPPMLGTLNDIQLIGIVLGVFWKGRPYWR